MLECLGKKEKGFTLMELLIAVAIVVILAGVGIPIYLKFMTGTKHAEANTNLASIKLGEEGYKLANGVYASCTYEPRDLPDQDAIPWTDRSGDFSDIDFTVSGNVRFVYEVIATTNPTGFTAGARGDTDGDTSYILYLASDTTSPAVIDPADTTTICNGGSSGDQED
jgi:prepilin-type N-terminal cleavage/methylation domain-containing protein